MAIFYMRTNIIGRSSGRSATGAAAYRRSAKMQSVAHAAYQRGEKIIEKGNKITHDYRSKGGVLHSEIILPEGAPPEFMDAQTLWNAVEASEKRKDAQLAREIIVALPREFNLQEQIKVMREYVKTNFVNKGIIADFSIHNKGDDNLNLPAVGVASGARNQTPKSAPANAANPHAHIMLTMRHVSQNGFGLKNTDWNKKEFLLSYCKAWAHIINSTFERKGSDEHIDHRSYKEQGIDRLPYIHLGHEAAALEKKGIRTAKGNYNREITRRNAVSEARAALMEANYKMWQEQQDTTIRDMIELQQQQQDAAMQTFLKLQQQQQEATRHLIKELQQQPQTAQPPQHIETAENNANINTTNTVVPNEVRTTLTTAKRISEPQDTFVPRDEKSLTPKENRTQQPTVIEKANHMEKFRQKYKFTNWDLTLLKSSRNVLDSENFYWNLEIEETDERAKNVRSLLDRVPQLEAERQNLHFWNWRRKKELDKAIEQAVKDSRVALLNFGKTFHVNPDEISRIVERLEKKIKVNEPKIAEIDHEIANVEKKLEEIKQKYDQYKLEVKIKVRRKLKKQPPQLAEPTKPTDRQSVRERLQEIRRPEKERKRRKAEIEKLRAIKPTKFLMIASPEQKKRSLGDVLGKYYRKINGRVYPSVPPAKEKKI